jgi:sorting and assembly machinery component 37
MVLELHVWGPAFSLPSIEAQCLATIAYFSLAVPKDAWVLIASSDPSVSPTNELPAVKNGTTWVSRFRNIVDYLRQYSNGAWDLDRELSGVDRADNIA